MAGQIANVSGLKLTLEIMMDVTSKMVYAAVKQAVKDKILPTHSDMDTYTHHYECIERILKAAIKAAE